MKLSITIKDVIKEIKKYIFNSKLIDDILWAYNIAFLYHDGQFRRSKELYIIHPLWTAYNLAKWKLSPDIIIAGLLHDVLEDTPLSKERLELIFDQNIGNMVSSVTKVTFFAKDNRSQIVSKYLRKLYLAMAKDIRVILVKLADRLHNIYTLKYLNIEKQKIIAKESLEIYASIAHRLGMKEVQHIIEDKCFRILKPVEFTKISTYMNSRYAGHNAIINEKIKEIQEFFYNVNKNIYFKISGRSKSFYSIYKKIYNQGKTLDEISDILAIRIIVESKDDCYVILGYIHQKYTPLRHRFKDYIATPKPNFYQSLHTTVVLNDGHLLEVQIRTTEMDELAEKGVAAHWKYKENNEVIDYQKKQIHIDEKLDIFSHILDLERITSQDKTELYNDLKANYTNIHENNVMENVVQKEILTNFIYALTPNSKVISLPYGATILDFAYQIHSGIGIKTIGAKINGVFMPIDTVLNSGDVVEVKTSNNQKPNHKWLKIAKTSRALNKIRKFLHQEEQKLKVNKLEQKEIIQNKIKVGREEYQNYILKNNLKPSGTKKLKIYRQNLKALNIKTIDEVFLGISEKKWKPEEAFKILHLDKNVGEEEYLLNLFKDKKANKKDVDSSDIIIPGIDQVKVQLAKCCLPLPFEQIIGVIARLNGIKIHNKTCKNITLREHESNSPLRLVEVKWNKNINNKKYESKIIVQGYDRMSLLLDVTKTLSKIVTPITSLQANLNSKTMETIFKITIQVSGISKLNKVINILQSLPDIKKVVRKG